MMIRGLREGGRPAARPVRRSIGEGVAAGRGPVSRKCDKRPVQGICGENRGAIVRPASRSVPAPPHEGASASPMDFHICGKALWIAMAITSFEEAAERTWTHVVERARRELSESSFSMWFQDVRATSLHDGVLEIVAPSDYVRDWLAKHYVEMIQAAAAEAAGLPVTVHLGAEPPETVPVHRDAVDAPQLGSIRPPADRPQLGAPGLPFPNYTFDTFVAGPSNRFAHAAAMAVGDALPSKAYNPLFIYGGVGLGKTHLLVAIGHHMHSLLPRLRVKYVTSESFMAEFIKAVRERQGYQFAARYRDVDVLLVDDIQFLAKREETQTEFFHTFNALHQKDRELEGALVRVVAWSDLTGHPITTELAEQALEDLLPQAEAEIAPQLILEESAKYFSLSVQDLISPNRSRPLTTARHVAMYLMRECSGQSLVKIGETFGGRDHTTARHGILKVERDMRVRGATYRQVQDLSRIIRTRARSG